MYKYLAIGLEITNFVKKHSDADKQYEDDIMTKLEFLIDNLLWLLEGLFESR